jgi:hypothetical protein
VRIFSIGMFVGVTLTWLVAWAWFVYSARGV